MRSRGTRTHTRIGHVECSLLAHSFLRTHACHALCNGQLSQSSLPLEAKAHWVLFVFCKRLLYPRDSRDDRSSTVRYVHVILFSSIRLIVFMHGVFYSGPRLCCSISLWVRVCCVCCVRITLAGGNDFSKLGRIMYPLVILSWSKVFLLRLVCLGWL